MKLMRKNGITRFVTDREALHLKANGYDEVVEKKADGKKAVPGKTGEKKAEE